MGKVFSMEETVDELQHKIIKYISNLFTTGYLNEEQSIRLAGVLEVSGYVERMSDSCKSMVYKRNRIAENGEHFSEEALHGLSQAFECAEEMVEETTQVLKEINLSAAKRVLQMEETMNQLEFQLRQEHIERLNRGTCTAEMAMVYTELLHNLERIGDDCKQIAAFVFENRKGFTGNTKQNVV